MLKKKIKKPTQKPAFSKKPRVTPVKKDDSEYLTVDELSSMLTISKSHIYHLTSTKGIPFIKVFGRKVLFERAAIKNWLKSKSVAAN